MGIRDDADTVLRAMSSDEQFPGDSKRGRYSYDGEELRDKVNLSIDRMNDAVELLANAGHLDVIRAATSHPYSFLCVELSSAGRAAAEDLAMLPTSSSAAPVNSSAQQPSHVQKAGIIGFLENERDTRGTLWVVLGAVAALVLAALGLI